MDIRPNYATIFHSKLLEAVESVLKPELIKYHSVTDIIPTTDRKRWIVELHLDYKKKAELEGKDSIWRKSDQDTGLGRAGADQLSLITGGVEGQRITEAATEKTDAKSYKKRADNEWKEGQSTKA